MKSVIFCKERKKKNLLEIAWKNLKFYLNKLRQEKQHLVKRIYNREPDIKTMKVLHMKV